jgi:tetratricopeptide (TPR) repeat protein
MRGEVPAARELIREAERAYQDLGLARSFAANSSAVEAEIAMLAGDPASAESTLRESCEVLDRMGEHLPLSTQAAQLAEALCAQGRDDEAEAWARRSAELAPSTDASAQILSRAVRARLFARRGLGDEGEALAREAVARAEDTDALNDHAKALLALAEVLRLGGDETTSAQYLASAIALLERKGNKLAASTARALLDELPVA